MNTLAKKAVLYEDATKSWRLVEGDALAVLAGLPEHSVDAVVTDPPYGIRIAGEAWDGTTIRRAPGAEGLAPAEAFERWTQAWAEHCHRVLKPGGHLLAFGSPRTFHRLVAGIEDAGLGIPRRRDLAPARHRRARSGDHRDRDRRDGRGHRRPDPPGRAEPVRHTDIPAELPDAGSTVAVVDLVRCHGLDGPSGTTRHRA